MMDIESHYKKNKKRLVAVAKRNVVDNCPNLAEECVQQTYLKLWTFWYAGNTLEENFDGFVFRILFNVIHDCNETELKRGMTGRSEGLMGFTETVDKVTSTDISTFRKICLSIVLGEYERKDQKQHKILELFFVQGYSHGEIASELKITKKTSRNIVYRELAKLRQQESSN